MRTLVSLFAALAASPDTLPPKFPAAAAFNAQTGSASARQQQSMARIPAGTYSIGSPAQHPLADRLARPEHKVAIKPDRGDYAIAYAPPRK
jgi:hypothetical protein